MKPNLLYRQTIYILLITGTTYTVTRRRHIEAQLQRGLRRLSDQLTRTLVKSLETQLGLPLSQQQRQQWLTTWTDKAKRVLKSRPDRHPLHADLLDLLTRRGQPMQLQTDPAAPIQAGRLYRLETDVFLLITTQWQPYLFRLAQVREIHLTETVTVVLGDDDDH